MAQTQSVDRYPSGTRVQRITTLFLELLERQFPIDENHRQLNFRSASEFADQLNVHVNHLNRAVKETTQKTTSQLIAGRVLQESKILLKHSAWSTSEVACALGFTEVTHFNNFFKKTYAAQPDEIQEWLTLVAWPPNYSQVLCRKPKFGLSLFFLIFTSCNPY